MQLSDYLKKAQKEKFAIGQFNFSTASQLRAICEVAHEMSSPVIVGTSRGEADFLGVDQAVALVAAWRKSLDNLPVFLNLDHANDPDRITEAVKAGYDAVHFDGSHLGIKENTKITQEVAQGAHAHNVLVEGEVGAIGTESSRVHTEDFVIKDTDLTDPAVAAEYIKQTKADLLAISIGTFHGVQAKGDNPHLRLELLEKIAEHIPYTFLVLHGSSGTPTQDVAAAIQKGITKINLNTNLRLAYTGAVRKELEEHPDVVAPYKYLDDGLAAMKEVVASHIELFGSGGNI